MKNVLIVKVGYPDTICRPAVWDKWNTTRICQDMVCDYIAHYEANGMDPDVPYINGQFCVRQNPYTIAVWNEDICDDTAMVFDVDRFKKMSANQCISADGILIDDSRLVDPTNWVHFCKVYLDNDGNNITGHESVTIMTNEECFKLVFNN